jgi:hypothetical protein
VASIGNHPTFIEYQYPIGYLNGTESVRDDEGRPSLYQTLKSRLNMRLTLAIEC